MHLVLMFLKRRFWLLCLASLLSVHTSSTATPPSTPYAGWLDRSRSASVEAVEQMAAWEPFTGWKGWGYGPEPVWVRVSVPAAIHADAPPHILIVRPPYLDRLTFYDSATGAVRHAGDFLPAHDDALGSVLFTFEVPALAHARDVLVRLETNSARLVYFSLLPIAQAQLLTRWVEWATGAALVMSLFLWVWSMVQWRQSRDSATAAFAITQLLVTVWAFSVLGFARVTVGELFAPGVLSLLTSVSAALMVAAVMWFFAALLLEYTPKRWQVGLLVANGVVALATMVFHLWGPAHLALQVLNGLVPFLLGGVVLMFILAKPANKPAIHKWVMIAYVVTYFTLNSIPTLTHIGFFPETPILFFGNLSSLVANGLVMLIILNVRQRRLIAQHQAVSKQLLLHQEQARRDQQYLDEQRQLLAMLAHEMKTPLANLRIWMEAGLKGRPVMERAIGDMNRVIERCVHAGQLSDQSLQPRHEWLDAAELTQALVTVGRLPERVRLATPPDGCAVFSDAQMLSIVLSNLLENAHKYSAADTPIDLALTQRTGAHGATGWLWCVENAAGPAGLPDADKAFDKYYRSPLAQRQSGSGLGLFLVKSLIELMGGSVCYTALPGRARFEVWIPVEPPARGA